MKIKYDKVADAIYFRISEGKIAKSLKMGDHFVIDVSEKGDVIGMELLDASSTQGAELETNIRQGVPISINSSTPAAA
jgi:uncharacterized protein YuzE